MLNGVQRGVMSNQHQKAMTRNSDGRPEAATIRLEAVAAATVKSLGRLTAAQTACRNYISTQLSRTVVVRLVGGHCVSSCRLCTLTVTSLKYAMCQAYLLFSSNRLISTMRCYREVPYMLRQVFVWSSVTVVECVETAEHHPFLSASLYFSKRGAY